MDKITESLKKVLPQEQVAEVSAAVEAMLSEAKAELEKEYTQKLEQAYAQLAEEMKQDEAVAVQGYQEAYGIIADLRNRLETQRAEFDAALEEGYEEAYQMIQSEKGKKDGVEAALYEEYDKKLAEMKSYMIDKIDQFLRGASTEIYEQARRDITNDPRMVEHKLALSKVVETVSDYISDEDFAAVNSAKLEQVEKALADAKGQVRLLEARSIRLSADNTKLNEALRQQGEIIKEHTTIDKKERTEKAKNVTGSGKQVTENVEVIAEAKTEKKVTQEQPSDTTLVESLAPERLAEWQGLAGVKSKK